MYAIVMTGGKQIKVAVGDKIYVEKLDVEAGKDVKLDQVLFIRQSGLSARERGFRRLQSREAWPRQENPYLQVQGQSQ